jgi:N6-adenosine-specific RNA methylase IME4
MEEVNRPVAAPYAFMPLHEICGLPVRDWSERNSVLLLWTINAYVPEAYEVAWAWGFRPSKLLTWCKTPVGLGPGGTFASTSEFILFATRGKVGAKQRIPSSWFQWPRGSHSEKPEAFLDLVEDTFEGPYLELFARRQRLGWDTWGNEALEHVELAV